MVRQCGLWVHRDYEEGTRDLLLKSRDACRLAPSYPVVSIDATDNTASESGDTGTFTISRRGGDTSRPLTVYFGVTGSATRGADYTLSTGNQNSVTIPAGSLSTTVTVTPISDNLSESDETVVLSLVPPPHWGSYNIDLSAQTDTVTITDVSVPTRTDMIWWFKSDAITGVSNGQPLSSWPDSAPTPHNMVFPGTNGGIQPLYVDDGVNNIGGKPVVEVDASVQGEIPYPNFSPTITDKSFTLYVVANFSDYLGSNAVLLYPYTTAGARVIRVAMSLNFGGNPGLGYEYDVGGGPVDVRLAAPVVGTSLITFVFDKTAGEARVYSCGTLLGSSTDVGGTGAGTGFDWGTDFIEFFSVAGGLNTAHGFYAELIGYSAAHDDTTRQSVESYLKNKYSICTGGGGGGVGEG